VTKPAGVFGRPGLSLSGDTAVGKRKQLVKRHWLA
jgi:hypothetical protein